MLEDDSDLRYMVFEHDENEEQLDFTLATPSTLDLTKTGTIVMTSRNVTSHTNEHVYEGKKGPNVHNGNVLGKTKAILLWYKKWMT